MRGCDSPSLVGKVYQAAHDPHLWPDALRAFEEATGDSVALFLRFPGPGDLGSVIAPTLDPAFLRAYRSEYFARDAACALARSVPEGVPTPIDDGWRRDGAPEATRDPATARTASRRQPSLFAALDRDHNTVSVIRSFARAKEAPPLAERRAIWSAIVPHLVRAVHIGRRIQSLEWERHALRSAIDRFRMGLLLMRPPALVVAKNRAAARILAKRDGLVLDTDGLEGAWPATTSELRGALRRAYEGTNGLAALSVLSLSRPSGRRPLATLVAACQIGCADCAPSHDRIATLYVSDPDEGHAPPSDLLRRFFGLTPSQAALACELAAGHPLESAAVHLGVSRQTARTRLKDVLRRTDTHRQVELVRLLLTGPGLLDLEPGDRD